MGKHNEFGKQGEQLAVDFLIDSGYTIRQRNYRYLKGEVDIIAEKKDVLAIVEVKSRSSTFLENIADTITEKKIKLLVQTADYYVTEHSIDLEVRFDIITVLKTGKEFKLNHIEDALT